MQKRTRILIGFALLFAMAIGLFGFIIFADAAAPEDGDLWPRPCGAVRGNGFPIYLQATRKLMVPDRTFPVGDLERFVTTGDLSLVETLRANQEALALLDRALACESFRVGEVLDPGGAVPSLLDARNVAHLIAVRARFLLFLGRHDRAIDELLKIVRLGQCFQDQNAVLITGGVGGSVKRIGFEGIRELLARAELSPTQLARLRDELRGQQLRDAQIAEIIRSEYRSLASVLDSASASDLISFGKRGLGTRMVRWLLYKPNATKHLVAESHRRNLAEVSLPRVARTAVATARARRDQPYWRRLLRANTTGEELVDIVTPYFDMWDEVRFQERALQVLIAIHLYWQRWQRLPGELAELVPEYLEAVPRDPFDGEPLRYAPDRQLIFSRGDRPGAAALDPYRWPIVVPR